MNSHLHGDGFHEAMLAGLAATPRALPCKYLYDAAGAALFERITELDEYYLTRSEIDLLSTHGPTLAARIGPKARVVEFGAGAMKKTRLLLAALDRPAAYLPIDVAREPLLLAARRIAAEWPDLAVVPLVGDFCRPLTLPPDGAECGAVLGFFPGSTIGNLQPAEARDFLRRAARLLGPRGWLVVGVDLVKDPHLLEAAYDDCQGITTAFMRNMLARANRELGADFDLSAFDHRAWWNAREGRIEIHLVASRRQVVTLGDGRFTFRRGETIHVENCYKYSVEQFQWLVRLAGWTPAAAWVDPAGMYCLHLLTLGI